MPSRHLAIGTEVLGMQPAERRTMASVGLTNLEHALSEGCKDPDCEIHNPEVIADDNSRLTAFAFIIAHLRKGGPLHYSLVNDAVQEHCQDLRDEAMSPEYP
jgi:hypothetical protein